MAGNDSLDTDSGDLVEVEMDIDEDVLIASDLSSDTFSESNDSDTGTNVSQNDNHGTPDTTLDSDEDISDDNLAVDIDNLQNDSRTCDEMFDVLMKDPEWSKVFKPIHVNQFRGPSRPTLPHDFDLSSSPVNYFQLSFTDSIISTICENMNKYKQFRCNQKKGKPTVSGKALGRC